MANEYKLSFTAAEINTRLGKIDNLAEKSEIPTKVSDLTNDYGFLTSYTETDPTVPAWAKAATKPSYTANEVGALPDTTVIPTVPTEVSAFVNDAGYLTEHQSLDGLATVEQVGNIYETKSDANSKLTEAKTYTDTVASGKANSSHNHSASNITSGILPTARGGLGNSSGYIRTGQKSDTTIGDSATAEGSNTTASGQSSHAEGGNTTASGQSSHAEGSYSTASGQSSHAEGSYSTASGQSSHAEGGNTTASGYGAHAEGSYSTASGDCSHAEGQDTTAIGDYGSHAEGYCTTASGYYGAHAEGSGTTASGYCSHAEGSGTTASGTNQHVQGVNNIEDANNVYAHIVGNGGWNPDFYSNAHTLDWDGNAWYAGDVYVGSTSGTNKDDGSKKLATEEYVVANAAPAGYGLGEDSRWLGSDELFANLTTNGWYTWGTSLADPNKPFGIGKMLVVNHNGNKSCTQVAFNATSSTTMKIRSQDSGGVWSEWEWVNPPMTVGVEYRTTERWQGKAVYTKLIDYGDVGPGYSRFDTGCGTRIIRASATHGTSAVPFGGVGELWGVYGMSIGIGVNNLHFYSGAENGTANLTVHLWYIK